MVSGKVEKKNYKVEIKRDKKEKAEKEAKLIVSSIGSCEGDKNSEKKEK